MYQVSLGVGSNILHGDADNSVVCNPGRNLLLKARIMKKEKIAVGYCRVSTSDQAENGLSIEVQEAVCLAEMKKDGYEILKVIKDEGLSGGSLKRKGIQEVISLTEQEKINAVYTVHSDRIARNVSDYLYLRSLFRGKDVVLKCIYQPSSDDSAASRTMDTVMASFNEMQRLVTSEKVKSTLYRKAEAGYFPASPPPGYINSENPDPSAGRIAKRIIIPDPIRGPYITELFQLYASGNYNVYELNDILYKKGLRSRAGKQISASRLYEVLRNRIYLGEVRWGKGKCVQGKHKPLIDELTFNKAQEMLATNNNHRCRRRKYEWLLNGFLYCYKHNSRYTAEWHLEKKIAYYHCTNKSGCGKYTQQLTMEGAIAEKFKELEFSPEFISLVIEKAKAIFLERRSGYDRNRQGLINRRSAYESRRRVTEDKLFDGTLTDDDFKRLRAEIKKEIDAIDSELAELESHKEVKMDIAEEILLLTRDIYKSYTQASPKLQKSYLGFFWDRFEVSDGLIIKSYPSKIFAELLKLKQANQDARKTNISSVSNKLIIQPIRGAYWDLNPD